jgi:hypothetical protein
MGKNWFFYAESFCCGSRLWTQLENPNMFCNHLDIIAAGLPHMPHFFIVLLHTFHKYILKVLNKKLNQLIY